MLIIINRIFRNAHIYWIMTAAMLALILVGTLSPQNFIEFPRSGSDKSLHFVAFAALVSPLIFCKLKYSYWVIPLALVLGALIEVLQPLVGRQREIGDFYADALGVLSSFIVILIGKIILQSK